MSEPMTTREIEDVLSSIRRLVSDDLRPAADGAPSATLGSGVTAKARSRTTEPKSAPTDSKGEGSGDGPLGKLLLTPALRVVPETTPDIGAQTGGAVADRVSRLGLGVPGDGWEAPLGDDEGWPMEWGRPDALARAEPSPLRFVHRARSAAAGQAGKAGQGAPDAATADSPSARAGASDTAPDADNSDWGEAVDPGTLDAFAQDIEGKLAASPVASALALDEVAVRNMVRSLIREELAGALGERITRNVRKLVRAEIARALTVRDMD